MQSKLKNKGKTCVFVGFAENHVANTYHMFDVTTKKVILTQDIIWANKTYGEYFKLKVNVTRLEMTGDDDDDNDDDDDDDDNDDDDDDDDDSDRKP